MIGLGVDQTIPANKQAVEQWCLLVGSGLVVLLLDRCDLVNRVLPMRQTTPCGNRDNGTQPQNDMLVCGQSRISSGSQFTSSDTTS